MTMSLFRTFVRHFSFTNMLKDKVGILGVPFDKGQPLFGVALGPDAIRGGGLLENMKEFLEDLDVKDYGNIKYEIDDVSDADVVENMKEFAHIVSCTKTVAKSVEEILKDGRKCITLGGDHSLSIGTVTGLINAKGSNVAILWIDAHADLNTNKTSSTGNVHGMPLALIVKELEDLWPHLPGMDWQKPVLSIRNVAYIGLRSVDVYERLLIEKLGVNAYGMSDIDRFGISNVVTMALDRIDPDHDKSIHVSMDIDALDSLEAPSTGTTVRGGLTLREALHIMETIYKTRRVHSMDLVEVNPGIGSHKDVKMTVDAAIHLILAALGHQRKGLRSQRAISKFPQVDLVLTPDKV